MKQNYHRIEEQIERFFEGQTSNEEEQQLYAFFSSENIPEHLLPYRPVFAYFETGIKEESGLQNNPKSRQPSWGKKISIWASVAASLLILVSFGLYHFTKGKEYNPYEGSYIIRNGVKITDPKIVIPEIEKSLYLVQQQEKEYDQLFLQLQKTNQEVHYDRVVKEIKQQHLKWVEGIEDENIRREVLKIINLEI